MDNGEEQTLAQTAEKVKCEFGIQQGKVERETVSESVSGAFKTDWEPKQDFGLQEEHP